MTMIRRTAGKLIFAIALCVSPALSSIYYNNEFFTRIPTEETVEHWADKIDAHSFINDFSCEHIFS